MNNINPEMKKNIEILIVEDSPTQSMKLKMLLERHDFVTRTAANGLDGLTEVRKRKPTLIISDIVMPLMDGFEMCSTIKHDMDIKDIPVILLTTLSDSEDIIHGINVGADYYITKPYDESFLLSKIENIIVAPIERKNKGTGEGFEVTYGGKRYIINTKRRQILTLLLSNYENAVRQNKTLLKTQEELKDVNLQLKEKLNELQASEERFRSLVLTIPDIVYRIDREGIFTFINDAIERLGYDPAELLGKHFSEIIQPADVDRISRSIILKKFKGKETGDEKAPKLFDERRTGKRRTKGLEVYLISKSGKLKAGLVESIGEDLVVVEINSAGLYGIGNAPNKKKVFIGTVGVIRDISARKIMEIELRMMNEEAELASRAKSDFLANMSHELRTPLNAIIGFSEILEDKLYGELSEKQESYVGNVLSSGRHLLQLINDILDLSKVEAGKQELEFTTVDIKGLLNDSMIMIKENALKHNIDLDLQIPDEISRLEFTADERKLKQIIFNLLSNAVKFTPDSGEIRVTAELADSSQLIDDKEKELLISQKLVAMNDKLADKQKFIRISVIDTGIGIEPEDQDRIFDVFEQVNSLISSKKQGTGLGLALTKKLVDLHGGRIWVNSDGEGKGSTFIFTIPLGSEAVKRAVSGTKYEDSKELKEEDVGRPLVLVVEDNTQAAELITQYLSEDGYSVANAFDGEEAIKMAHKLKPDAITLDILLPKKDGWDVLGDLKSSPETRDIPVIVISITENRKLGVGMGAIEWFVKPVEKESLLRVLGSFRTANGKKYETVLVVDDKPEAVDLLNDILCAYGYNVLKAYSGRQCIDLAIEKNPDVIILDLLMPQLSGFEVVEQLREHHIARNIPIFIYTSKDLTQADRQKLNSHVQAIASKSIGKEALLRALEKQHSAKQR